MLESDTPSQRRVVHHRTFRSPRPPEVCVLVPNLDTPEGLFGWMAARGVITEAQAQEMIAAVRHEMAEERDSDATEAPGCRG
jgi:hypothetical protein